MEREREGRWVMKLRVSREMSWQEADAKENENGMRMKTRGESFLPI
jgi:hypothetical protein